MDVFFRRIFLVILGLNVAVEAAPTKNEESEPVQKVLNELGYQRPWHKLNAYEKTAAFARVAEKLGDKDRKLVRYELDLGVRDAGEAAKKILEKRHVNYTDYAKKQPPIDPNDGRTVTPYLNFQRNKLDHAPGAIETGLVGNSFEEQYSLIVETLEKIFRGYSGMLDKNRKEEANHFISEEAILALTKGDF